jgi:polyisoprenoid-binding protein YceI
VSHPEELPMIRKLVPAVLLVCACTAPALAADKYTFDPNHSQIRFGWNHFGFSSIEADFREFSGELMLDTADLAKSSVNVTIPLASVDSGVAKLDDHLKSPDFFDVAKFPEATFKSTAIEQAAPNRLEVSGELTLHGVTKPVVLDVTVNKIGKHPMAGDDAAGFDAKATVKRSDFGVDKYAPNVSDEVWIEITTETHAAK